MFSNKLLGKKFVFIITLQAIVVIYTLSSVAAKFASGYDFMSGGFIFFYFIELLILFVYAILWQQIIKKFEISVAYANRSIALIWSLVWSILFFSETVTIKNIIGVIVVIIGTLVVNSDEC